VRLPASQSRRARPLALGNGMAALSAITDNWLARLLDAVWDGIVLGDRRWNPDKSCYDLAEDYRRDGMTPRQGARNFIRWQVAKAGAGGVLLNLPGLGSNVITMPAELTYTTYVQLRMVAVIALLYGWDARSDLLKTIALLCLLGDDAAGAVRACGVQAGARFTAGALAGVPRQTLSQINRQVAVRLVSMSGRSGALYLITFLPIVGGLVSGGLNAAATRGIGRRAHAYLRDGPIRQSRR
jgi:uncharacterized protein (DUF697 family)